MVDSTALAEFALLSVMMEITPGPNMAYLALVAATEGRAKGYAAVAGTTLGLALVGIGATLGLATLIAASPVLFAGMKWSGVAYLLWMAWDGWSQADKAVDHATPGSTGAMFFRRGLVTNLLNPKSALFYVTMLPGFTDPTSAVLPQTLMLSAVFVAISITIHVFIVTAAGAVQGLVATSGRTRMVRRLLALGLVGVAVWMAAK